MISSKDVLERTGLKSAKTLTRWHHAGIIPEPVIRTHPSGRGKLAYWPDWVLERCERLVELQRRGHTLQTALEHLELTRVVRTLQQSQEELHKLSNALDGKVKVKGNEQEFRLHDIFLAVILQDLDALMSDKDVRATVQAQLRESGAVKLAMVFVRSGFNPVFLYDGNAGKVVPDFLVGALLAEAHTVRRAYLVLPLVPPLRRTYEMLGLTFKWAPYIFPAPKVWRCDTDVVTEVEYFRGGPNGFELIHSSTRVLGTRDELMPNGAESGSEEGKAQ